MCLTCQVGTTALQLLEEGCRTHGYRWSVKKKKLKKIIKKKKGGFTGMDHVRGGEVSV